MGVEVAAVKDGERERATWRLAERRSISYFAMMAWFLFIDESGQDHVRSPYEVLAGIAVKDEHLWSMIQELHNSELAHFGRRYSDGSRELKGKNILKNKVFRHAKLERDYPLEARRGLRYA